MKRTHTHPQNMSKQDRHGLTLYSFDSWDGLPCVDGHQFEPVSVKTHRGSRSQSVRSSYLRQSRRQQDLLRFRRSSLRVLDVLSEAASPSRVQMVSNKWTLPDTWGVVLDTVSVFSWSHFTSKRETVNGELLDLGPSQSPPFVQKVVVSSQKVSRVFLVNFHSQATEGSPKHLESPKRTGNGNWSVTPGRTPRAPPPRTYRRNHSDLRPYERPSSKEGPKEHLNRRNGSTKTVPFSFRSLTNPSFNRH